MLCHPTVVLVLLLPLLSLQAEGAERDRYKGSALTKEERKEIVRVHNHLRRHEGAKNMKKLKWDQTLEVMAIKWAKRCTFEHGQPPSPKPTFKNVGQNIYAFSAFKRPINLKGVIMNWFNEKKDYIYENNSCTGVCGHYTQVVWADTTHVGCAAVKCPLLKSFGWKNSLFVVCNYGPAGNWHGKKPYEKGTSCGSCPNDCKNKLCTK